MSGIDDDLMESGISTYPQGNTNAQPQNETTVNSIENPRKGLGFDMVFRIIHYLIDVGMILLSLYVVDMNEAYPLFFGVGLIIWLAYRILYFKRSEAIDVLIGIALFIAATYFYIYAMTNDRTEMVGRMLIPTIYLGYFCVWGAIRRKRKGYVQNDK